MKWLLIGLALTALWYILAPLFTPSALRQRRSGPATDQQTSKRTRRPDLTVIDGQGRIVEEEPE